jgi:hypothetical protein
MSDSMRSRKSVSAKKLNLKSNPPQFRGQCAGFCSVRNPHLFKDVLSVPVHGIDADKEDIRYFFTLFPNWIMFRISFSRTERKLEFSTSVC